MTAAEQKKRIQTFVNEWDGNGDEKQETQTFWIGLLRALFDRDTPETLIKFERRVKIDDTTKFIDGYIKETKVLIEQKSAHIDLSKAALQSDGAKLTPFEQARRYGHALPLSEHPRWIVTSNFTEIRIHDMEAPGSDPDIVLFKDLPNEWHRLSFLLSTKAAHTARQLEISKEAGVIVGRLYDALLAQYHNPEDPESLKALNKLCVRLVFCLYAEDADIFDYHNQFYDYLSSHQSDARRALQDLFLVLDTPEDKRDPYMDEDLAAFPYVNGGLFADPDIEIPRLTPEIVNMIMEDASAGFDWSDISPTIFGGIFESTLNPTTRRQGGMHYTSIENIHKVIDPLFLDDLRVELDAALAWKQGKKRRQACKAFREKLGRLTFFDPACGSGNFLTETFLSLRRLENEALAAEMGRSLDEGQIAIADIQAVEVTIDQFYGIEINDFAVTVAKTALWIAELQMMWETETLLNSQLEFLPLRTTARITEGNALRLDWADVVPKERLNYIMGNPPFVGAAYMSKKQKSEIQGLFKSKGGLLDYVSGWYKKAAEFIVSTSIHVAFVSTNSITQGEQVAILWKPLISQFAIRIIFCHTTFVWDSDATDTANVFCVIVGFASNPQIQRCDIFSESKVESVSHISPYLIPGTTSFIDRRTHPVSRVLPMVRGCQPTDGGNLIIEDDELEGFLKKEPAAAPYIKKLVGSKEFINNRKRWCLWLVNVTPAELRKMPHVMDRVAKVKEMRLQSTFPGTRKLAERPTTFRETYNPDSYILIPRVSSERRAYIPMGFMDAETITTDANLFISDATIYDFGILTSSTHMAWMRTVAGRLEMRYRYSKDIVYNNFPWPDPTPAQKEKIEKTAQAILDARALYPNSSLADLYDETTMPLELRKAHNANDGAVLEAYGLPKSSTEPEIVAHLMQMYEELTKHEH